MIWRPKKGQHVRIHYNKKARRKMPLHGQYGCVYKVGLGPGPINVLVGLSLLNPYRGLPVWVVVPRGNLINED